MVCHYFFHRANIKDKNGDVEFYGKVVDQNQHLIEGAEVKASSRLYAESIEEQVEYGGGKVNTKKIETITDAAGLFAISGYRAKNLRIEVIHKPGYSAPSKLSSFSYSPSYSVRHTPDASDPVVFPMWEKNRAEPLVKKYWRKRIVPDGRSYSFDFDGWQVAEGVEVGDVIIKVNVDYASGDGTINYPWSIEINVPDSGVVETEDLHPYLAPKVGFGHRIAWRSGEISEKWTRDLQRTLYPSVS